ncbi:transcription factor [Fusarium langsethiae]|jgi:transcription initiation factor TFIIE subunit beta|uniref:Transcription initiation factor IIE subunit beta n=2 Tax=Fusarium sambucinum species complex TaxID=569360 RepID=A0A0M9F3Q9_FUSLA|nr:transcription factor [Fusarium langsethiae]RGP63444.1 transcription initiation factor tfiie subunit beta [Fusarium sporotrichioides]GKT99908.1 unnamed protein product [Fusarium langsethiae]GKU12233.1 unnamed protein product [Fusarium langsethiae]
MSSYLEKQANAFRGTLSSAATKISNPSTNKAASLAVPSSLAPPSPSPSAASDPNTPTTKRKRDAAPEVPYSQPQLTGYGAEVKTQMTFAVEYLKKKGDTKTITEIIDHLSLRGYDEEHKRQLAEGLRGHPRVDWKPDANLSEQTWKTGTYAHRPIIPGVKNATTLLGHLQAKTDASGVSVKDLKDGWPDCEDTISALEREYKILVVRTKKDNLPRYVWPNDASLHHRVQPEFQSMWQRVQLPPIDEMHRKLTSVGQKPTSEDPRKTKEGQGNKPKVQKRRKGNRIGKATNVHMAHLMQDYSGMRR